jgi:hypothetical protein
VANIPKAQVFVASASENLGIAEAIQELLNHDFHVTVWNQNVFRPSQYTLDALFAQLDQSHFGVLVLDATDILISREKKHAVPRDNVIFELGLFVGALGKERTFFLVPQNTEKLHLPTDLMGLTPVTYDKDHAKSNPVAALGTACSQIKRAINDFDTSYASEPWYTLFHHGVVHEIRKLAVWINSIPNREALLTAERVRTNELCTKLSSFFSSVLDCEDEPPHCCLKINDNSTRDHKVISIGRSEPFGRDTEFGLENAHSVQRNTVFASMLQKPDGIREWPRPFSSFSCNDLPKHKKKFACDRKNWDLFYKSTLAYPIRYPTDRDYIYMGFLTFDRDCINGFPGVPCTLDLANDWGMYERECRQSREWHFGACIADMLAVTLLPKLRIVPKGSPALTGSSKQRKRR